MTEVTRVPLQPIAKGSLTKLWLGVLAVVLLAAGVAWSFAPKGVDLDELVAGSGSSPTMGDVVFIKYVGTLDDGEEFDRSTPMPIPPGIFPEGTPMLLQDGAMIDGFLDGLLQMKKGGKYRLQIPADLAYGDAPPPSSGIPANSDLTFEVELVDFMSEADANAKMAALQAAMGQGEGPEGAAPPPPPQN